MRSSKRDQVERESELRERTVQSTASYRYMKHYVAFSGTLYEGRELAIRKTTMDGAGKALKTELLGWVHPQCDHNHCLVEQVAEAAAMHFSQLLQEWLSEAAAPLVPGDGEVPS